MAKRRGKSGGYERAFEELLRAKEVLYLAVDEARRPRISGGAVKNFDFIVSSFNGKYLIDIKGKKFPYDPANYWENWISDDDISGLKLWATHFSAFVPLLVYVYEIRFKEDRPKFIDWIVHDRKCYGFVAIDLGTYHVHAKLRGKKWRAISVSRDVFKGLVKPLSALIPELKRQW